MSFDLEHDRDLHDRLLEQSHGSSFAIVGRSEAGEMTEQWTARVRRRISGCDEVVVICGEYTDESARVGAELAITREEKKPYVLLWGRRESMCKKPTSAAHDDGIYSWTPAILAYQLAYSLRQSREPEVPESMKRQVRQPRVSPE
jgi:hypothetical protein